MRTGAGRGMRALLLGLLLAGPADAADYFLTVGGGYAPWGNQVSLERNVLYFQRMVEDLGLADTPQAVLFADGESVGRDVQYALGDDGLPRANLLLARVFQQTDGLFVQYRSHELPRVRGACSVANLDEWFRSDGALLQSGDRLVLYLTGHGGKSDDETNPHFFLWNHERMSVRDLAARLDQLPQGVQVVLVMVQCYSGGFANLVFQGGDPGQGPARAPRCGFFATVPTRPAAGCTPDIREENYREYSSAFWAGLYGQTRTGEPVAAPDYDGDGRVTFAEAHAYVILSSDTIDIPVKTSEFLLRSISRQADENAPDLLSARSPFDRLWAAVAPCEQAVLTGLSTQLGLTDEDRAAGAARLADELAAQKKSQEETRDQARNEYQGACRDIAQALRRDWPELPSLWNPAVCDLLAASGPQLVAAVEAHPRYSQFEQQSAELMRWEAEVLNTERRWVKCQRLLRALENAALAANLPRTATAEQATAYAQVVALEGQSLVGLAALPPAVAPAGE